MCHWLCRFFNSSLGKKYLVGAAGFLLCGFLLTHLAGNLFLYVGESTFNHYAKTLEGNPALPLAEAVLFALFLLHIAVSLWARRQNAAARPVGYVEYRSKGGRSVGSSTMLFTGLLTLAFLIVHVKSFKFTEKPEGLFRLVMNWFSNPLYCAFYVAAMGGLALHLGHGFQSAFQTFGVNHPKYTTLIRRTGMVFALVVSAGFASLPIWAYLQGGR